MYRHGSKTFVALLTTLIIGALGAADTTPSATPCSKLTFTGRLAGLLTDVLVQGAVPGQGARCFVAVPASTVAAASILDDRIDVCRSLSFPGTSGSAVVVGASVHSAAENAAAMALLSPGAAVALGGFVSSTAADSNSGSAASNNVAWSDGTAVDFTNFKTPPADGGFIVLKAADGGFWSVSGDLSAQGALCSYLLPSSPTSATTTATTTTATPPPSTNRRATKTPTLLVSVPKPTAVRRTRSRSSTIQVAPVIPRNKTSTRRPTRTTLRTRAPRPSNSSTWFASRSVSSTVSQLVPSIPAGRSPDCDRLATMLSPFALPLVTAAGSGVSLLPDAALGQSALVPVGFAGGYVPVSVSLPPGWPDPVTRTVYSTARSSNLGTDVINALRFVFVSSDVDCRLVAGQSGMLQSSLTMPTPVNSSAPAATVTAWIFVPPGVFRNASSRLKPGVATVQICYFLTGRRLRRALEIFLDPCLLCVNQTASPTSGASVRSAMFATASSVNIGPTPMLLTLSGWTASVQLTAVGTPLPLYAGQRQARWQLSSNATAGGLPSVLEIPAQLFATTTTSGVTPMAVLQMNLRNAASSKASLLTLVSQQDFFMFLSPFAAPPAGSVTSASLRTLAQQSCTATAANQNLDGLTLSFAAPSLPSRLADLQPLPILVTVTKEAIAAARASGFSAINAVAVCSGHRLPSESVQVPTIQFSSGGINFSRFGLPVRDAVDSLAPRFSMFSDVVIALLETRFDGVTIPSGGPVSSPTTAFGSGALLFEQRMLSPGQNTRPPGLQLGSPAPANAGSPDAPVLVPLATQGASPAFSLVFSSCPATPTSCATPTSALAFPPPAQLVYRTDGRSPISGGQPGAPWLPDSFSEVAAVLTAAHFAAPVTACLCLADGVNLPFPVSSQGAPPTFVVQPPAALGVMLSASVNAPEAARALLTAIPPPSRVTLSVSFSGAIFLSSTSKAALTGAVVASCADNAAASSGTDLSQPLTLSFADSSGIHIYSAAVRSDFLPTWLKQRNLSAPPIDATATFALCVRLANGDSRALSPMTFAVAAVSGAFSAECTAMAVNAVGGDAARVAASDLTPSVVAADGATAAVVSRSFSRFSVQWNDGNPATMSNCTPSSNTWLTVSKLSTALVPDVTPTNVKLFFRMSATAGSCSFGSGDTDPWVFSGSLAADGSSGTNLVFDMAPWLLSSAPPRPDMAALHALCYFVTYPAFAWPTVDPSQVVWRPLPFTADGSSTLQVNESISTAITTSVAGIRAFQQSTAASAGDVLSALQLSTASPITLQLLFGSAQTLTATPPRARDRGGYWLELVVSGGLSGGVPQVVRVPVSDDDGSASISPALFTARMLNLALGNAAAAFANQLPYNRTWVVSAALVQSDTSGLAAARTPLAVLITLSSSPMPSAPIPRPSQKVAFAQIASVVPMNGPDTGRITVPSNYSRRFAVWAPTSVPDPTVLEGFVVALASSETCSSLPFSDDVISGMIYNGSMAMVTSGAVTFSTYTPDLSIPRTHRICARPSAFVVAQQPWLDTIWTEVSGSYALVVPSPPTSIVALETVRQGLITVLQPQTMSGFSSAVAFFASQGTVFDGQALAFALGSTSGCAQLPLQGNAAVVVVPMTGRIGYVPAAFLQQAWQVARTSAAQAALLNVCYVYDLTQPAVDTGVSWQVFAATIPRPPTTVTVPPVSATIRQFAATVRSVNGAGGYVTLPQKVPDPSTTSFFLVADYTKVSMLWVDPWAAGDTAALDALCSQAALSYRTDGTSAAAPSWDVNASAAPVSASALATYTDTVRGGLLPVPQNALVPPASNWTTTLRLEACVVSTADVESTSLPPGAVLPAAGQRLGLRLELLNTPEVTQVPLLMGSQNGSIMIAARGSPNTDTLALQLWFPHSDSGAAPSNQATFLFGDSIAVPLSLQGANSSDGNTFLEGATIRWVPLSSTSADPSTPGRCRTRSPRPQSFPYSQIATQRNGTLSAYYVLVSPTSLCQQSSNGRGVPGQPCPLLEDVPYLMCLAFAADTTNGDTATPLNTFEGLYLDLNVVATFKTLASITAQIGSYFVTPLPVTPSAWPQSTANRTGSSTLDTFYSTGSIGTAPSTNSATPSPAAIAAMCNSRTTSLTTLILNASTYVSGPLSPTISAAVALDPLLAAVPSAIVVPSTSSIVASGVSYLAAGGMDFVHTVASVALGLFVASNGTNADAQWGVGGNASRSVIWSACSPSLQQAGSVPQIAIAVFPPGTTTPAATAASATYGFVGWTPSPIQAIVTSTVLGLPIAAQVTDASSSGAPDWTVSTPDTTPLFVAYASLDPSAANDPVARRALCRALGDGAVDAIFTQAVGSTLPSVVALGSMIPNGFAAKVNAGLPSGYESPDVWLAVPCVSPDGLSWMDATVVAPAAPTAASATDQVYAIDITPPQPPSLLVWIANNRAGVPRLVFPASALLPGSPGLCQAVSTQPLVVDDAPITSTATYASGSAQATIAVASVNVRRRNVSDTQQRLSVDVMLPPASLPAGVAVDLGVSLTQQGCSAPLPLVPTVVTVARLNQQLLSVQGQSSVATSALVAAAAEASVSVGDIQSAMALLQGNAPSTAAPGLQLRRHLGLQQQVAQPAINPVSTGPATVATPTQLFFCTRLTASNDSAPIGLLTDATSDSLKHVWNRPEVSDVLPAPVDPTQLSLTTSNLWLTPLDVAFAAADSWPAPSPAMKLPFQSATDVVINVDTPSILGEPATVALLIVPIANTSSPSLTSAAVCSTLLADSSNVSWAPAADVGDTWSGTNSAVNTSQGIIVQWLGLTTLSRGPLGSYFAIPSGWLPYTTRSNMTSILACVSAVPLTDLNLTGVVNTRVSFRRASLTLLAARDTTSSPAAMTPLSLRIYFVREVAVVPTMYVSSDSALTSFGFPLANASAGAVGFDNRTNTTLFVAANGITSSLNSVMSVADVARIANRLLSVLCPTCFVGVDPCNCGGVRAACPIVVRRSGLRTFDLSVLPTSLPWTLSWLNGTTVNVVRTTARDTSTAMRNFYFAIATDLGGQHMLRGLSSVTGQLSVVLRNSTLGGTPTTVPVVGVAGFIAARVEGFFSVNGSLALSPSGAGFLSLAAVTTAAPPTPTDGPQNSGGAVYFLAFIAVVIPLTLAFVVYSMHHQHDVTGPPRSAVAATTSGKAQLSSPSVDRTGRVQSEMTPVRSDDDPAAAKGAAVTRPPQSPSPVNPNALNAIAGPPAAASSTSPSTAEPTTKHAAAAAPAPTEVVASPMSEPSSAATADEAPRSLASLHRRGSFVKTARQLMSQPAAATPPDTVRGGSDNQADAQHGSPSAPPPLVGSSEVSRSFAGAATSPGMAARPVVESVAPAAAVGLPATPVVRPRGASTAVTSQEATSQQRQRAASNPLYDDDDS